MAHASAFGPLPLLFRPRPESGLVPLTDEDISSLQDGTELSDNVVLNAFVISTSAQQGLLNVDPIHVAALEDRAESQAYKRPHKAVQACAHGILLPVFSGGNHWACVHLQTKERRATVYDSLASPASSFKILQIVKRFVDLHLSDTVAPWGGDIAA